MLILQRTASSSLYAIKIFHWAFFSQYIPPVLYFSLIVWSLRTFVKFSNQVCISHTIQALLRAIVGKNFHANVIEALVVNESHFATTFTSFSI
jgi:hypothetical protein